MGTKRLLLSGLFIFECIKTSMITFLIPTIAQLGILSWTIPAVQSSLFPIMTLFLYINFDKYKNYLSLYIAGKCIGIIIFFIWIIFIGRIPLFQWIFEGCNLLTLAIAFYLNKTAFIKEEGQCE